MRQISLPAALRLLPLSLLLAGCALAPVDTKPAQPAPEVKSAAGDSDAPAVSDTWWKTFGDAGLDAVVARALAASPDLDAAYARVRASRAAAGLADTGFWPTLGTEASYNRSRSSGSSLNPAGGQTSDNFAVGGSVAYEIDLWGRVRNESAAAAEEYRSAHADLAGARLLVAAEVTRLWLNLAEAKTERATLIREYEIRTRAHELLAAREKAGLIGGDEVSRAKLSAAQAKYDLDAVELKVSLLRNALVATVGEAPGGPALPEPADTLPATAPALPAVVPSAILRSRPDIAAADLRLEAALAREGAVRANYYPNLTLSATGGFSSINAGDLFSRGSRVWSIGPTLSLPIFSGGRNDAAMESARAKFDAEWAGYRKSVLNAFRETEDALVTLDHLADQEKLVAAVVSSADDSLGFAKARYDKGLSSNLEVILAERDTLAARRELIRTRFNRLRASADLARALGGGWDRETAVEKSQMEFEDRLNAADKTAKAAKE